MRYIKRTSEASKAVREAWKRERTLVMNGAGTRDWTPKQQRSILLHGKAYDSEGKAFQGHHMQSVASYPQYQNKADNIQFLSKTEHLKAHHGNFRTQTNGFYNYATGETINFNTQSYTPCKKIQLSRTTLARKAHSITHKQSLSTVPHHISSFAKYNVSHSYTQAESHTHGSEKIISRDTTYPIPAKSSFQQRSKEHKQEQSKTSTHHDKSRGQQKSKGQVM